MFDLELIIKLLCPLIIVFCIVKQYYHACIHLSRSDNHLIYDVFLITQLNQSTIVISLWKMFSSLSLVLA